MENPCGGVDVITPLECRNRFHGGCRTEWCMSPSWEDSEEGTSTGRRDSERRGVKMDFLVLCRTKDSRME